MTIIDLPALRLDEFYQVFSELMHEGYADFPLELREYFLSKDYPQASFSFWLERNVRKILVALEDDKIAGFLIGDHTYGGVGFISWLGVLPSFRRRQFASALLQEYEKYAKSKNAHLLELFAGNNVKAFYERLGFTCVGHREHGYYGQENNIMDKVIGEWSPDLLAN